MTEPFWLSLSPHKICEKINIQIDRRMAEELANLFDGDVSGWYYLSVASIDRSDEAAKWMLGHLAARLNELKKPFNYIYRLLPPDYLGAFVDALVAQRFHRSFAKSVFAELLEIGVQYEVKEILDEMTPENFDEYMKFINIYPLGIRRISGDEVLDKIISDPRFKAIDNNEIDGIIKSVIAANPEQAAKAKINPKLIGWFVGQVMKASQGKAPASDVQEKLSKALQS